MVSLPKAILFDLDETILSFGDREQTLIEVAEDYRNALGPVAPETIGRAIESAFVQFWADKDLHKQWRFKLSDARILVVTRVFEEFRSVAPLLTDELAKEFAVRFHERREIGHAKLFEGAMETLDELKRRGVRLALVTNGEAAVQREKVVRFDLERRFDHIQIEGEMGFGKPEDEAYLHAMKALGVEAKDTWMVGDNLDWEVVAPQRLGIYAIWLDARSKGLPPNSKIVPDRIVQFISELL